MATDVLAVLDALGLERVKLVGHDWGGWIGFLLCLRAPQRFERFLALNIVPPWVQLRSVVGHAWRFWYQQVVLAPGLGYRLHRRGDFVKRVLVGGSENKEVWTEETLSVFADNLTEPARARAAVQMYRVFNWREALPIARGRYADATADRPDPDAVRDRGLRPASPDAGGLPAPRRARCGSSWSPAAATSSSTSSRDLVAERAREFLAPLRS